MKYIFTPTDPRTAGTTLVVSESVKVRLEPGTGEIDDTAWNLIKADSTIKAMIESDVLRVEPIKTAK